MKLLFYIIFSLNLQPDNAAIDIEHFNSESTIYFQELCFNPNIEKPFSRDDLNLISNQVLNVEKSDFNIVLANHFLFRYFLALNEMELAYQHGIHSLELAESFQNNTFQAELNFIRGFYFYYSQRFDAWMSIKHLFRGVRSNANLGMELISTDLPLDSKLYQLNLTDQYQLQHAVLFDYDSAIHTLNSLLVVAKNKKQIFRQIADLQYMSGGFEQAISIYQQIASDQPLESQPNLTEKIISCYFYMAEFDISKQYIRRYLKPSEIESNHSILEMILQMEKNESEIPNDSLFLKCINYYQLSSSIMPVLEKIQLPLDHFNVTDLFLNRKNLRIAEKQISELKSSTDSLFTIKQFSYAKLYWAKQDFFNSKRYLHNLLNKYQNYFNKQMWVQANYILANIAYEANDFEQSKSYLEIADPQFLYFYQRPKFNFLLHHFRSN